MYGIVLWVIGALLIMPAMLGMGLFMFNATTMMSLVGHLLYGLIVAGVLLPSRGPGVTGTAPLLVVVSATCATCRYTMTLVEAVRRLRPRQPVEVTDLDDPQVVVPGGVVGTPTFLLGERVVSLGNPTVKDLLAGVDAEAVLHYTALARQAVSDGLIGYALIVAEKP